ncbi:MAG: hypothetical protein H7Y17_07810 [Chlorobia bacterium]|nr:hypothetical protein [Fimbriimonadaceae bacterium]
MRPDRNPDDPYLQPEPGERTEPEIPTVLPGPEVIPPSIPIKPDFPPAPRNQPATGGDEQRDLVIEHPDKHRTDAEPQ